MSTVAPTPAKMDRSAMVQLYGELEADEGAHEFVTMKDGWTLHTETWVPNVPAKAVVLFAHGGAESTRTLGVRRLAHAFTQRGIVLATYDQYGHGESMQKNGKQFGKLGFRGGLRDAGYGQFDAHYVEIAEHVIEKHRLPFIMSGHSLGGTAACMATDAVITKCEALGVPFVTALYLAPGLGNLKDMNPCGSLACCRCCCIGIWACCLCNCCGQPCISIKENVNPGEVLGPDNTGKYLNLGGFSPMGVEAKPYPRGSADLPDAVARMTKLQQGLAVAGSKDSLNGKKTKMLADALPALKYEEYPGLPHHVLNMNNEGDDSSVKVAERLASFVEEKLNALAK